MLHCNPGTFIPVITDKKLQQFSDLQCSHCRGFLHNKIIPFELKGYQRNTRVSDPPDRDNTAGNMKAEMHNVHLRQNLHNVHLRQNLHNVHLRPKPSPKFQTWIMLSRILYPNFNCPCYKETTTAH
jgi:hypothetical protein